LNDSRKHSWHVQRRRRRKAVICNNRLLLLSQLHVMLNVQSYDECVLAPNRHDNLSTMMPVELEKIGGRRASFPPTLSYAVVRPSHQPETDARVCFHLCCRWEGATVAVPHSCYATCFDSYCFLPAYQSRLYKPRIIFVIVRVDQCRLARLYPPYSMFPVSITHRLRLH